MKHGTVGAYANHGCRCDLCRAAHRIAQRVYRGDLHRRGLTSWGRWPTGRYNGLEARHGGRRAENKIP
jgi:hypothetical protein